MNRYMFALVVVIAAAILGCQNTPTDPAGSSAMSVDGLSKALYPSIRIPLSGTPREPYPNSGLVFDMSGFVDYALVRVNGNENVFNLLLSTNARLAARSDNRTMINLTYSSTYVEGVSEEGVAFQQVRYLLPERSDRLALFITFQITQDNVAVADMWLDFIE